MAVCDACSGMSGKSSTTAPHAALVLVNRVDLGRASHGMTRGEFVHWRCGTCGSLLVQDLDEKDDSPQWDITRAG